MNGKTYKTLETPGGIGEVRKGSTHIAKVFYRLIARQEILAGETAGLGGLEISGDVSVSQDEPMQSQVARLMNAGDTLVLYLEDGRHFDIRLTQGASPDTYRVVQGSSGGFSPA
jgi:hypothetical protein